MTYAVLRHRCDICGMTWLMQSQAEWCERMCAEEAASAIDTGEGGDVQQAPSRSDESAVPQGDAR